MDAKLIKSLESFDRVWQRVEDARRGGQGPAPVGLMPKKQRRSHNQRYGPKR